MKAWAIVPAAGAGERLGGGPPKALREVAGRPMIAHVVLALLEARSIAGIVIVGPAEVFHTVESWTPGLVGVEGGSTRRESVAAGLGALPRRAVRVIVHDAARPLVTPELIERVVHGLRHADAVVAAVPVHDTLKRVADDTVRETVSREGLWRAQTPQGFRTTLLAAAHERARADGFEGTDDAALVERIGVAPVVVPGDEANIKVTMQADADMADALLRSRWRVE